MRAVVVCWGTFPPCLCSVCGWWSESALVLLQIRAKRLERRSSTTWSTGVCFTVRFVVTTDGLNVWCYVVRVIECWIMHCIQNCTLPYCYTTLLYIYSAPSSTLDWTIHYCIAPFGQNHTTVHCIILYYITILYFSAQYYTTLYYSILSNTALCCTLLYFTVEYYIQCTALYFHALNYTLGLL